jgi:putative flippase GtrA
MKSIPADPTVRPARNAVHAWVRRTFSAEQRRVVKFAVVGGSGVFVNLLVVALVSRVVLVDLGTVHLPLVGARQPADFLALLAGIAVSIFTNFVINDRWTWGDRDKGTSSAWWARCANFYLTNGMAAALQFAVAWGALRFALFNLTVFGWDLTPWNTTFASLLGIGIATPLNYVINHLWTFRER